MIAVNLSDTRLLTSPPLKVGRIWKCNPHGWNMKEKVYEGETSAFTGLALLHV
jgi:hypothetical protein